MAIDKNAVIKQIASVFSLSEKEAETACLLLEARAELLDFTFHQYIQRYHPDGFLEKEEDFPEAILGYKFSLRKSAFLLTEQYKNKNPVHFKYMCAHIFFRQLVGDLRFSAEKSYEVVDGKWQEGNIYLFFEQMKKNYNENPVLFNKWELFLKILADGMENIYA